MTITQRFCPPCIVGLLLLQVVCGAVNAAETRALFSFVPGADLSLVQTTDARIESVVRGGRMVLRVRTGSAEPWPGVTFGVREGSWDLSPCAYVILRARNAGDDALTLHLRVDNPGADGSKHCLTSSIRLDPGASGTVRVDLKRTEEDRLDQRRGPIPAVHRYPRPLTAPISSASMVRTGPAFIRRSFTSACGPGA
jgi:hypothetical protein